MIDHKFYENDDRAKFANTCLKRIWQSTEPFSTEQMQAVKELYLYFNEYVRNVYEVITDEIPLFAYYNAVKHGPYNVGWDEIMDNGADEVDILDHIKFACCNFYN